MSMPWQQKMAVAKYIAGKKMRGEKKYPLVLELEPLLQCNLACAGCGKIEHPDEILRKRLSVEECIAAVEECGAPMVSIAGGEPLVHKEIDKIVQALVERKRFVYLCTNAILLEKKLDLFTPSPYFSFSVHIDGLRERHDESVSKEGVFDEVVEAVREAKRRGFKVNTNSTFFNTDTP
ncbi:MAG: adenosyl-hopene transferase HpnH, partial [Candidatus Eremiobacteraeota bacterium]|nr:adenosyl-hopene transferase HpnH [Candidatus Eremiobacteraeota bacterium]